MKLIKEFVCVCPGCGAKLYWTHMQPNMYTNTDWQCSRCKTEVSKEIYKK